MILAIEAAVEGGSLSLFSDGEEIAGWIGPAEVSRAEQLLPEIHRLLDANDLTPQNIDLIAASAGPGSFTGIRIGLSTALGLCRSLGRSLATVSILHVLAQLADDTSMAAIPMGRNFVCIQSFTEIAEPRSISRQEFDELVQKKTGPVVVHGSLIPADRDPRFINAGRSLATHLARYCEHHPAESTSPLFISKN